MRTNVISRLVAPRVFAAALGGALIAAVSLGGAHAAQRSIPQPLLGTWTGAEIDLNALYTMTSVGTAYELRTAAAIHPNGLTCTVPKGTLAIKLVPLANDMGWDETIGTLVPGSCTVTYQTSDWNPSIVRADGKFIIGNVTWVKATTGTTHTTTTTTTAGSIVGTWAGTVAQNGIPSFHITLTVRAPMTTRTGTVAIPSSKCTGTLRFLQTISGRSLFAMTWQKGNCVAGTASLQLHGKNSLSYRWSGTYPNGTTASSAATLTRSS